MRKPITPFVIFFALPVFAEPVRIVVLGDSLVAGYGLPAGDGLVPQLQSWLDQAGAEVTLVNAGVSGDTTTGGLSRFDWSVGPDADGLIVALGGNDVLRGIDPATSRASLETILGKAADRALPVLLVASPAPGNYGPAYKQAFEAIYPELAANYDVPLYEGFLPSLVEGEITQDALKDWFQADGIHPNKTGVGLIVEAFGPVVVAFAGGIDAGS